MSFKKSLVIIGASSLCCVGVAGIIEHSQWQLSQAQAEIQKLKDNNQALKIEKYEKVAEEIKNHHPKTVVGEVFENGYLKKHGNHYHFVYGTPPEDAIYESNVQTHSQTDDGYVFDKKDVVEESELGYVVRHGDHYHFIYKNPIETTSVVGNAKVDHYHFNPSDIVRETPTGYVVRHGDHYHFLFKESNSVSSEEEPFEFNKDAIVSEDEKGYVVRHGDHTHYIFKEALDKAPTVTHEDGKKCRLLHIPHGDHFHDVLDCSDGTTSREILDDEKTDKNQSDRMTVTSAQIQPYLDYIAYAYGVERDTIRLQDFYDDNQHYRGQVFVFQNMEQGQDKSHVHPWVIPMQNFELPLSDPAIPAELRFAKELESVAHRMGIPTTAIRILGDKFEVPHGDHSHTIAIKNKEGIQPYLANQLKELTPVFQEGDLDEAVVIQRIKQLKEKATQKFAQDELTQYRILMSLTTIQEKLSQKGNSTQGYLTLLETFEKQYINQVQTESELPSSLLALNQHHETVIQAISELDLSDYGVTHDELRQLANTAMSHQSEEELAAVTAYVTALRAANDRPGIEGMRYLYFFTQHLFDKELSAALRDQVATLIEKISTSTIIVGEEEDATPLYVPSYHAELAIKKAHEEFNGIVDTTLTETVKRLTTPEDEESMSTYESMKTFADEVLDSDQKDNTIPVSDIRNLSNETTVTKDRIDRSTEETAHGELL